MSIIAKILLRSLSWERKNLDEKIAKIEAFPLDLIAQAFPEGSWSLYYDGPVFEVPYNFEYIPLIKEFMELQFPQCELIQERAMIWDEHEQASYILNFQWDSQLILEFRLDSRRKGTTCVLNKIGEKIKTIPVYEVTCSEEKW